MARKEINIFGTSFLDLLSGALGAVIILYVIVPKMSVQQQETLRELEALQVETRELSELMERVERSVDRDLYQQIQRQLQEMEQSVERLTTRVEQLQAENTRLRTENEQLREQVREQEADRQRIRELERQVEQLQQQQQLEIANGMVFGTEAALGVVCVWPENVDVDLYVRNKRTGAECYFNKKNYPWGNLLEDVREQQAGRSRYELFYQREIVPGEYEICVRIYSG